MLLLIDAGNTRIKWALAEPAARFSEWVSHGAGLHEDARELAAAWQAQPLTRVLMSNVAGEPAGQQVRDALGLNAGLLEQFKSSARRAGLVNAYRDPAQLGSDRFASAIGARALYPDQALLIVTCGTATTIDAISAEGVFTGGMILPGLRLMAAALHRHTAQLPAVAERMHARDAFADNTEDAIVLGCLSAQAGAIERARARMPQARCIISGGAGRMVEPFLDGPSTWVDNLVLLGLHAAAMEKEGGC